MFGPKAPLKQQVEDGDGGGGGAQKPAAPWLEAYRSAVSGAQQVNNGPGTGTPQQTTLYANEVDQTLSTDEPAQELNSESGGRVAATGRRSEDSKASGKFVSGTENAEAAKVPTPYRLVGSTGDERTTYAEDVFLALQGQQELAAAKASGNATLQAARASTQAFEQMRDIGSHDATVLYDLINNELPKFHKANQELTDAIDAARQMRINPHAFRQSLGTAGRTASALAVGVMQIAAGAGQPNSIAERIEASVEQDIEVQAKNMEQVWKGIAEQGKAIDRGVDLLNNELVFRDQARAVAYAAISAEIQRANQQNISEHQFIANQMLYGRFKAAEIHATAQARAKLGTLYVDAAVSKAYQAEQYMAAMDAANQGFMEPEGAVNADFSQVTQPIGNLPQQQADGSVTQALYSGGEQVTGAPQPSTSPSPDAAPAPSTPASQRASKRRTRPQTDGPTGGTQETAPEQTSAEEQAATEPTPAPAPAPGSRQAYLEEKLAAQVETMGGDQVDLDGAEPLSPEERAGIESQFTTDSWKRYGGSGRARLAKSNSPVWQEVPTTEESIIALRTIPSFKRVAGDYDDAVIVRRYDKRPVKTANMSDTQYMQALKSWQYRQNNPELYMEFRNYPDEITFLESDFGNISLKAESALTSRDNKWEAARIEVLDEMNNTYHAMMQNYEQAQSIYKTGVGTFFGFNFDEDGFTFAPFDPEFRSEKAEQMSRMTTLGIGQIKAADPSGRLTDQDIKIGKEMAGQIMQGMRKGTNLGWDALQTIYNRMSGNNYSVSKIRQSIGIFFAAAAHALGSKLSAKASQHVVYDHRSTEDFKSAKQEMDGWMMRTHNR